MADLTKEAILAMEQRYLPRVLALEVAVLTCAGIVEDYADSLEEGDVKEQTKTHLALVTALLNDKEYLANVFNEEMKRKLSITKLPLGEIA